MSFCCCLVNENGFVMAADSRSTFIGKGGAIVHMSDSEQKIVYLPKSKFAIAGAGQNRFNNITFATVIESLDEHLIGESAQSALNIIATHLRTFGLTGVVNLCIATAKSNTFPEVYFTYIDSEQITTAQKVPTLWNNIADEDICAKVYNNANNKIDVNIATMNLIELEKFAQHLVQMTTDVHYFKASLKPIVGGQCYILSVDRNGLVHTNSFLDSGAVSAYMR